MSVVFPAEHLEDGQSYLLVIEDSRLVISKQYPASVWRRLKRYSLLPSSQVEPLVFASMLLRSQPLIGHPQLSPWVSINLHYLDKTASYHEHLVPLGLIERARRSIPPQKENWSCGVNSSARFGVMLRQAPENYINFLVRGPIKSGTGILGIPAIGGNGGDLTRYMKGHPSFGGSDIGFRGSGDARTFEPQKSIIELSLRMGRPVMVLLAWNQTSMHWVNLVGWSPLTQHFAVLNTNGGLYEASFATIRREMDAGFSVAHTLGFISFYNSITCTRVANFKDPDVRPWSPDATRALHTVIATNQPNIVKAVFGYAEQAYNHLFEVNKGVGYLFTI